jgi:hypothetical protein
MTYGGCVEPCRCLLRFGATADHKIIHNFGVQSLACPWRGRRPNELRQLATASAELPRRSRETWWLSVFQSWPGDPSELGGFRGTIPVALTGPGRRLPQFSGLDVCHCDVKVETLRSSDQIGSRRVAPW